MFHGTARCITFDLDDTLWDCASVILGAERALYAWFWEHCPEIPARYSIDALRLQRQALMESRPEISHDVSAVRRLWLSALLAECGCPQQRLAAGMDHFMTHRNRVTLFEGVAALLHGLSERYILGAITNGNARLEPAGIDHWFDFVVYAADVGAAKPDARVFQTALAHSGVDPGQVVHIGDDLSTDVSGAAAVGMRTIWFNRHAAPGKPGVRPDATVSSHAEIAPLFL